MEKTIAKNSLRLIAMVFAVALLVSIAFANNATAMPSYCGSYEENLRCYGGNPNP